MEFGKVDTSDLNKINFKLSPDHIDTTQILAKAKKFDTQFYIGCSKVGSKDWIGKLYPHKTKQADFLTYYAKHFNCIELNATFYRMPTPAQVKAWKSKVGKDFKFCPKFVDQITHFHRLKNVKELTDQFLEAIYEFGDNLGPILFMPHPQMGPKTLENIQIFLESLPEEVELFTELRHFEWFSNQQAFDQVFELLKKQESGAIITDTSGRRDCIHMRLSKPEALIRFVGNGLHPTDYTRIDDWVQRIKHWKNQGIQRIWFFIHQHEELHAPELCRYLIPEINKHSGTNIKNIHFIESGTLF